MHDLDFAVAVGRRAWTVSRIRPSFAATLTLAYIALLAALALASVLITKGHFVYSLDDPYIHLALAENILRGVYGVNLSEYSSPSSSVVYPFLLAATEAVGLQSMGPLLLNGAAGAGSVYLLCRFLQRYCLLKVSDLWTNLFAYAAGLLLMLGMSALALPMTGLEHMIHVFLVVVVITGLADVLEGGGVGLGFGLATVMLPLVRFEGVALDGAVVIALWGLGHRRAALTIAAASAAALGAYVLFMLRLGLPLLPSSVLLKSSLAAATADSSGLGAVLASATGNLAHALSIREGLILALALAGLLVGVALSRPAERRANAIMAATAGAAIAAHLLGGQYNSFHRYEVYANTIGLLSLAYVFRARLAGMMAGGGGWIARGLVLAGLAVLAAPYAYAAARTPLLALATYDQQFQMHRFAADYYDKPVAVNDLGLVSYRNDNFVLDLWGLGSERVRLMKRANTYGADDIGRLVADDHVGLVMVFEPWFQGRIPTTWRRAAVLHTRGAFAACDSISFFVTPSGDFAQVSRALAQFRRTLPARDSLSPDYDPSSVHCHQNTFDFGGTAKAPDPAASPKA